MLLIKNGKVYTMNGVNYEKGYVLVNDGKITDVGDCEALDNIECETIDAKGGWIIPGIIEAHCHIGIHEENIGAEGQDYNEATDPVTPELKAIDAVNPLDPAFKEAVRAGITTVMTGPGSANAIGGQFIAMKTHGVCIDEMAVKEPAAVKAALGENPKRVYKGKNRMPSTRMATAALIRGLLNSTKNYEQKKKKAENNKEYFETDIKLEAMLPVIQREIPLKVHAHRADDILTAIRIAKEYNIDITLDHCTEGNIIAKYIKKAGVPALVGPTMTFRGKIETSNKTFKTPKVLINEGIKTAIITDHPVTPIQYLPICAGLAVKEGLSIEDGLKTITINAAEILGIDDRVGSIEPGKDADIAVFNGNPMEIATDTLYTIINGEVVYCKEK